jgi:hypothetical protein
MHEKKARGYCNTYASDSTDRCMSGNDRSCDTLIRNIAGAKLSWTIEKFRTFENRHCNDSIDKFNISRIVVSTMNNRNSYVEEYSVYHLQCIGKFHLSLSSHLNI